MKERIHRSGDETGKPVYLKRDHFKKRKICKTRGAADSKDGGQRRGGGLLGHSWGGEKDEKWDGGTTTGGSLPCMGRPRGKVITLEKKGRTLGRERYRLSKRGGWSVPSKKKEEGKEVGIGERVVPQLVIILGARGEPRSNWETYREGGG